jgi:hypothetical protein
MINEERWQMDKLVTRRHAIDRVAEDLGLRREGKHYYCPGCQSDAFKGPEMVIKEGRFQCFRCEAAGDVVGLVKLARECDQDTAIKWLEREIE